jgi:hypothetical protein
VCPIFFGTGPKPTTLAEEQRLTTMVTRSGSKTSFGGFQALFIVISHESDRLVSTHKFRRRLLRRVFVRRTSTGICMCLEQHIAEYPSKLYDHRLSLLTKKPHPILHSTGSLGAGAFAVVCDCLLMVTRCFRFFWYDRKNSVLSIEAKKKFALTIDDTLKIACSRGTSW